MTELIITRGLPASGKTTWAKTWVRWDEENRARVNRDELRFALFGRYWPVDEPVVTTAQRAAVRAHLKAGRSVVVDDTHLRRQDAVRWAKMADELGVLFDLIDFTEVPLALCLERDRKREEAGERFVGRDVIIEKFNRYLKGKKFDPIKLDTTVEFGTYTPDTSLPPAYIVDLDGTLARMKGRSPYEWARVGEDEPVEAVVQLVRDIKTGLECGIIVMSGRDGVCRPQTEDWLALYGVPYDRLVMRTPDDKRPDDLVKAELFFRTVGPYWNVRGAIDDRDRVVKMWRSIGLMCAQVAEGDF